MCRHLAENAYWMYAIIIYIFILNGIIVCRRNGIHVENEQMIIDHFVEKIIAKVNVGEQTCYRILVSSSATAFSSAMNECKGNI